MKPWRWFLVLGLFGCQEASLFEGGTQVPTPNLNAMHLQVSPSGLTRIYEVDTPEGLHVEADIQTFAATNAHWDIGPLEVNVPVATRQASSSADTLALGATFRSVNITVPVRVRTEHDLQVCRFSVRMPESSVTGTVSLQTETDTMVLKAADTPVVDIGTPIVERIGSCAIDANHRDVEDVTLATRLTDYLATGIQNSSVEAMELAPLDIVGLVTGTAGLRRISVFEHRRGAIGLAGGLQTDEVSLSSGGLAASLSVGLLAQRAQCAPPVEVPAFEPVATRPIDVARIDATGSDFGLGVSRTSLQQMTDVLTVSGFLCRGLEDGRRPEENSELFPTDDVGLDNLDLDWMAPGPWIRVSSAPGALPVLTLRPQTNDIVISWKDFSIDLYGEVQGTEVRLARLTTDAHATLRPQIGTQNRVVLNIDALNVTRATVTSDWQRNPPSPDVVFPWARRATLLLMENQFVFPMPLLSPHPIRLNDIEVREHDVVGYFSFDD